AWRFVVRCLRFGLSVLGGALLVGKPVALRETQPNASPQPRYTGVVVCGNYDTHRRTSSCVQHGGVDAERALRLRERLGACVTAGVVVTRGCVPAHPKRKTASQRPQPPA